jgi:hypothetical protein
MDNLDQARASLTALFCAPSAEVKPANKFAVWQAEARIRAYTLLLTLERISDGNPQSYRFGQLAEQIGSAMEQEERAQASQEASQTMLTLLAALQCGR